jgi:hypothetical protein
MNQKCLTSFSTKMLKIKLLSTCELPIILCYNSSIYYSRDTANEINACMKIVITQHGQILATSHDVA